MLTVCQLSRSILSRKFFSEKLRHANRRIKSSKNEKFRGKIFRSYSEFWSQKYILLFFEKIRKLLRNSEKILKWNSGIFSEKRTIPNSEIHYFTKLTSSISPGTPVSEKSTLKSLEKLAWSLELSAKCYWVISYWVFYVNVLNVKPLFCPTILTKNWG